MTPISETASFVATMLFNLLLVGIVISTGVSIALKLTRSASPRMRYLFVVISFLAAAVLPFVLALIPARAAPLLTVIENSNIEDTHVTGRPITDIHPESSDTLHRIPVPTVESVARLLSNPSISIGLFSMWLIGACLLLGREAIGHLGAAIVRRAWRPANRDIREFLSWPENIALSIDNEFGPCALGVIRPTVVMPAHLIDDLSPRAVRHVARHELDHLQWRDPLMNTLMRMIRACLWPSLPLWYLNRAACLEREAAADRAVIQASSVDLRLDIAALEYASTLLSIAKKGAGGNIKRRFVLVATEIGREPGLSDRVRRLMAISSRPKPGLSFLAIVTLLASGCAIAILPVAKVDWQIKQTTSEDGPARTFVNNFGLEVGGTKEHMRDGLVLSPGTSLLLDRKPPAAGSYRKPMTTNAAASDDHLTVAQETQTLSPALPSNADAQDFESRMAAVGYKDLLPRQLADMKAYAVSPAYVAEMVDLGYGGLSADMLIRFKWLAVSSAFIREMKALGYDNLNPRTLADFRQQGVSSTYIREMRALVSGPITAEQLVSLRFFGASTEFVHQIKTLGFGRVNAGQLISMRLQGVTVAYIEEMRSRGLKELSVDELIGMRMRRNN
jgi:beta-lactamase regulating signal transducer with metallopeptidase domain